MPDRQFVDTYYCAVIPTKPPLVALSKETFAESNELINSHITLECGRQINDAKNIFIHETTRAREERHALGIFKHSTQTYVRINTIFFFLKIEDDRKLLAKVALEK